MATWTRGVIGALLLALPAGAMGQADGAMFRGGAAHLGSYEGAPGRALAGLRWRVPTGGDVIASPTIAGGTVFIGSGDGRMYAIALATGAVRWSADLGSPVTSSAAVGAGRLYVGTRDGRVHALDAATGATRWRLDTGADMPWPWGHESGDLWTSSPALAGGAVVIGSGDGAVYAIDARTGKVRWRAPTGGRVRSSPAVAEGRVYVGSADGAVYAFDLATGRRRWRYATEGATLESGKFGFDRRTVQSSPAVSGGMVYVGARDGFLYALSADSGTLRWRADHKVSWVNTSPAVRDGVVYAGSSDGQFVQALDAATGAERWRTTTGLTWSSPAVTRDMVYAGSGQGALNALDRATGRLLWRFRTGSQVFSSPAVAGDIVVVGSTDGSVYALGVDTVEVDRAVFLDSAYLKSARVPDPTALAVYLSHRGYRVVNAAALAELLRARTADRRPSVVVFAVDHLPGAILDSAPERSPLRRYLDAGGKVVWPGLPPLLWPADSATGRAGGLDALNWRASSRLLGVAQDAAIFDRRGVRATEEGRRRGLPDRWRDGWGIAPDPSITILGRDEWGLAAAWSRSYGGPPGTGFVRVPADDAMAVYLVAESR